MYNKSSRNRRPFRSRHSRSFRNHFRKPETKFDHSKFVKKAKPVQQTIYQSSHKFEDFEVHGKLKANIKAKNFTNPTAIQDQSIIPILEGKDLVGIANTGTGKTAAFLIPLIDKVFKAKGVQKVLIVVPTRELASQIDAELRDFTRNMGIYSIQCIGGTSVRKQIFGLKRKFDFIIGTPGRLKDMVENGHLNLDKFQSVVLDEVDRMLDMGFIDDVRYLMSKLAEERQSLFFSATMDKQIEPLMEEFLTDPVKVSVKTGETSDNIEQNVVKFSQTDEKLGILHDLLDKINFEKVLIFDKTKQGVENLSQTLLTKGFKAASIHGDKKQSQRWMALRQFKENRVNILVATDVAARGLDIDNVSHVINFDTPESYETYIHRIGRTGRGNKSGIALTFVKV